MKKLILAAFVALALFGGSKSANATDCHFAITYAMGWYGPDWYAGSLCHGDNGSWNSFTPMWPVG